MCPRPCERCFGQRRRQSGCVWSVAARRNSTSACLTCATCVPTTRTVILQSMSMAIHLKFGGLVPFVMQHAAFVVADKHGGQRAHAHMRPDQLVVRLAAAAPAPRGSNGAQGGSSGGTGTRKHGRKQASSRGGPGERGTGGSGTAKRRGSNGSVASASAKASDAATRSGSSAGRTKRGKRRAGRRGSSGSKGGASEGAATGRGSVDKRGPRSAPVTPASPLTTAALRHRTKQQAANGGASAKPGPGAWSSTRHATSASVVAPAPALRGQPSPTHATNGAAAAWNHAQVSVHDGAGARDTPQYPIDPVSGYYVDPATGFYIDPSTGYVRAPSSAVWRCAFPHLTQRPG